ncbi:DUF2752 domain-containing protein [Streptomyces sp. NBC_01214]|uniref:DUF2752 domain-containing protein n=1 Tax=Streptomyces sp. NBC_01214 TaxID=2903777 RepID=UPI00224F3BEB|nr:DUF2752 domain-containing protein [Streptomyces sp. NBC_01214]MCX4802179.1 DUF2752 domain-containing protein [Streptomyces sp. NBC_01214]
MSGENQQVDASRTPDAPPSPAPVPAEPGLPAGRPSPSRGRRLAVPVSYLAGVTAAFVYVGAVDPNEPGHYPVCPLFRLTGVLCPGCGGLRSAHAFANGDLVTALGANALAVAGYFVFAAFMALWLVRAFRGRPTPRIVLRPRYWWALGALALVFALVRNFSFGSALAP